MSVCSCELCLSLETFMKLKMATLGLGLICVSSLYADFKGAEELFSIRGNGNSHENFQTSIKARDAFMEVYNSSSSDEDTRKAFMKARHSEVFAAGMIDDSSLILGRREAAETCTKAAGERLEDSSLSVQAKAEAYCYRIKCLALAGKLIKGQTERGRMLTDFNKELPQALALNISVEGGCVNTTAGALMTSYQAIKLGAYDYEKGKGLLLASLNSPKQKSLVFSTELSGTDYYENIYYIILADLVHLVRTEDVDSEAFANFEKDLKRWVVRLNKVSDEKMEETGRKYENTFYRALINGVQSVVNNCKKSEDPMQCLEDNLLK